MISATLKTLRKANGFTQKQIAFFFYFCYTVSKTQRSEKNAKKSNVAAVYPFKEKS